MKNQMDNNGTLLLTGIREGGGAGKLGRTVAALTGDGLE